jgi:hypothetical protein
MIDDGLWEQITSKEEYARKQTANEASYIWDHLIEKFGQDFLNGQLEFAASPSGTERAIRQLAREDRFARRILGKSFKEFLDNSQRILARMTTSPSGVVYVFLASPHDTPRDARVAELGIRCFVARGLHPKSQRVVGIATERYEKGKGFSLDLYHLFKPTWAAEDRERMDAIQKEFGFFANPKLTTDAEDECPQS